MSVLAALAARRREEPSALRFAARARGQRGRVQRLSSRPASCRCAPRSAVDFLGRASRLGRRRRRRRRLRETPLRTSQLLTSRPLQPLLGQQQPDGHRASASQTAPPGSAEPTSRPTSTNMDGLCFFKPRIAANGATEAALVHSVRARGDAWRRRVKEIGTSCRTSPHRRSTPPAVRPHNSGLRGGAERGLRSI